MRLMEAIQDYLVPPVRDRCCFLHIPKCAGTSFSKALYNAYKPWRPSLRNSVFQLEEMAAREAEDLSGRAYSEIRQDILAYALSLPEARCVMGHFILNEAIFETFCESWKFITVLRDPVKRWISHYCYDKNLDAQDRFKIFDPLEVFLETERARALGRSYATFVAPDKIAETGQLQPALEATVERLRRFAIVGTIEDIEPLQKKFQKLFRRRLPLPRKNVGDLQTLEIEKEVIASFRPRIEEICAPDVYVYKALFNL